VLSDVYTAAVAIAAAMMKRHLDQTLNEGTTVHSMDEALDLLKYYGHTRPSARRCLATLTSILQHQAPLAARPFVDSQDTSFSLTNEQQQGNNTGMCDLNANGPHGYHQTSHIDWTIPISSENAAFEFLSDQWLMQPQLDSFNYVGI
jgi:hypothetical protein